jgi:hypothetical protein
VRRLGYAVPAAALAALSCGNLYYRDWPPSYRHETILVGEARPDADARSLGLAGAGRAAVYGAEAAVANPAALAYLRGSAASAGGGYRRWGYDVQPDQAGLRAQSFFGSFAGAYAAAAWAAAPERLALGGALWTPYDYTYEVGGPAAGGEMTSRGALRAAGPAAAFNALGVSWGAAADFLWGTQTFTSTEGGYEETAVRGRGYDVRASAAKRLELSPGWRLAAAVLGKKGAAMRFANGSAYDVRFPPAAGAAFSLQAYSVNVHLDYVYTFYEAMEAGDAGVAGEIAGAARNAGWASAGAEYVTPSGAVARTGFSYRPWYINDGLARRVDGYYYALGGGWPTWGRHGRLDAALGYGRRGALDRSGYQADVIDFQASFNYFW